MLGEYGIGIGKEMLEMNPGSVFTKMKAFAAAGSEARMCGCNMPVIITSGSGNQGIASSVPVIVYATEKGIERENAIVSSCSWKVYSLILRCNELYKSLKKTFPMWSLSAMIIAFSLDRLLNEANVGPNIG